MNKKNVIGIDEVGRGPLAGPVFVGIVEIKSKEILKEMKEIKCSKKLNSNQRERWSKWAYKKKREGKINFKIVKSNEKIIDREGINKCIHNLIKRGMKALNLKEEEVLVLLDGGLKAPERFINQKTIIKGDEKESVISIASVIAKVSRDNFMKNKSEIYPKYGFERHKGYGTALHRQMVKLHGPCALHRQTYLKKILH